MRLIVAEASPHPQSDLGLNIDHVQSKKFYMINNIKEAFGKNVLSVAKLLGEYTPYVQRLAETYAPHLIFHPEEGRLCCYPDDPRSGYNLVKKWRTLGVESRGTDIDIEDVLVDEAKQPIILESVPIHYQYHVDEKNNVIRIKYWVWYNFNETGGITDLGSHLGDWESVEVVLSAENERPLGFILSNHRKRDARYVDAGNAQMNGKHVKVWVAGGNHAHYESPNSDPYCYGPFCDKLANGGAEMPTWKNVVPLTSGKLNNDDGLWGDALSPIKRQFEFDIPERWTR